MGKNTKCTACKTGKQHTKDEWKLYHPLAGHGYNKEQGFSSEGARLAHEEDVKNSSKGLIAPVLPAIGGSS